MKRSAVAAAGALVLVAGALLIRSWGRPGPAPAPPPMVPSPMTAAPAAALPPDTSAGSIALQWLRFLGEMDQTPPADPAQQELARSRERQLADELRLRLAQDPSRWGDLLEVLSEENPAQGRRIVDSLRGDVGEAAEKELVKLVAAGRHRETRMASAMLVADRTSTESLWALVTSAKEDPDPGVRYQSLAELLKRQGRNVSEAERTTIDQELRWHADRDPDPAIRQYALRAMGKGGDPLPPPPPPKPARKKKPQ